MRNDGCVASEPLLLCVQAGEIWRAAIKIRHAASRATRVMGRLVSQSKFFQLAVKRASGNAERFSRFDFVSIGLTQRIFDNAAFPLFNVADCSAADFLAMAGGVML